MLLYAVKSPSLSVKVTKKRVIILSFLKSYYKALKGVF